MSQRQLTEALTQAVNQAERVFDENTSVGEGDDLVADLMEGVKEAETTDTNSAWESIGALAGLVAASALRRRMLEGDGRSAGGGSGAGVVRDLMSEEQRGDDSADSGERSAEATDSDSGSGIGSVLKRAVVVLAAAGAVAYFALRRRGSSGGSVREELGVGSTDMTGGSEERATPDTDTDTGGDPGRGGFDEDERATTSADAEVDLGSDEDEDVGEHVPRGSTTDMETGEEDDEDELEGDGP